MTDILILITDERVERKVVVSFFYCFHWVLKKKAKLDLLFTHNKKNTKQIHESSY